MRIASLLKIRAACCPLILLLIVTACSDEPIEPADEIGLTFTASGLHPFEANGTQDPNNVLASSFAFAFADSLQGLVAIGYSPADSAGDVLILQLPRQPGTYACGQAAPCHGRLLSGVRLFTHPDGYTGWTTQRHFEIETGSVNATQVGPTRLRGTFQATLRPTEGGAPIQINDGKIDVEYNPTPPPPGQSMRGVECLLRLSGGAPMQCS
jgi:hypothetical protein